MPLGLRATAIRFDLRPTPPSLERFERWAFHDLEGARRRDAAWLAAFEGYVLNRGAVQHVKRTMRRLVRLGSSRIPDSALRQIGVPTALLWGESDRMVPRAHFFTGFDPFTTGGEQRVAGACDYWDGGQTD